MYNKNHKYLYCEDKFGSYLAHLEDLQPQDEDTVFVTIIAEKIKDRWSTALRGVIIAINLKKTKNWKFYDNCEEFCEEFLEAVL